MKRREATLALVVLAVAPLAGKGQSTKPYRLGFLSGGSAAAQAGVVEALRDGLRERGWVEGRNISIDFRFAENDLDRLPELAAGLVQRNVDLIVATPAAAAVAARKVTDTIPIVMASVANPIGLGLIASFARPGGNVTGLAGVGDEIHGKRLQILKEAVPNARRVAILANPASATYATSLSSLKAAAKSLGVSLQLLDVRVPEDLDGAFAAMAPARTEALLVVADPLFGTHAARLAELVAKYRLPSIFATRGEFEPGGLILYGASIQQQVREAGAYVDKLLKGARPGDLAVAQPTKFELVINLKTAKALGVNIPPPLLLRADQIID